MMSLAACSAPAATPADSVAAEESSAPNDAVTLVDVDTNNGIVLKLPSDMTAQGTAGYTNAATADVVTFGVIDAGETHLTETTQEDFVAAEFADYNDVAVLSYENSKQINGKDALVCHYIFKSDKGTAVTGAMVLVGSGVKEYVVSFLYPTDDSSLAANLQACIDSITVTAAE